MAEIQDTLGTTHGKVRSSMVETILLFAVCLLLAVAALGVCVYLAVTGALFTLDGLSLVIISLSIAGLFMLNIVWSVYTGELRQVMDRARKKSAPNEPPSTSSGDSPR